MTDNAGHLRHVREELPRQAYRNRGGIMTIINNSETRITTYAPNSSGGKAYLHGRLHMARWNESEDTGWHEGIKEKTKKT